MGADARLHERRDPISERRIGMPPGRVFVPGAGATVGTGVGAIIAPLVCIVPIHAAPFKEHRHKMPRIYVVRCS